MGNDTAAGWYSTMNSRQQTRAVAKSSTGPSESRAAKSGPVGPQRSSSPRAKNDEAPRCQSTVAQLQQMRSEVAALRERAQCIHCGGTCTAGECPFVGSNPSRRTATHTSSDPVPYLPKTCASRPAPSARPGPSRHPPALLSIPERANAKLSPRGHRRTISVESDTSQASTCVFDDDEVECARLNVPFAAFTAAELALLSAPDHTQHEGWAAKIRARATTTTRAQPGVQQVVRFCSECGEKSSKTPCDNRACQSSYAERAQVAAKARSGHQEGTDSGLQDLLAWFQAEKSRIHEEEAERKHRSSVRLQLAHLPLADPDRPRVLDDFEIMSTLQHCI